MQVLVRQEFRVSKKEPLGEMVRRLYAGLAQTGEAVSYRFSFVDSGEDGGVSAVQRAVKKFPQLAALATAEAGLSGSEADLGFEGLCELADGVPRSLPFHAVSIVFLHPGLGMAPGGNYCGISAIDNWWVTGRMRALQAGYVVDVPPGTRKMPLPAGALGEFLGTLGKPKSTVQTPLDGAPAVSSELLETGQRMRGRLPELLAGVTLPHALTAEAPAAEHPLKPALVKHFQPLGYSCKGGSGTFSLRKRTAENHVLEVDLDVGTWSRRVLGFFRLHVPGYQFRAPMPVVPGVPGGLSQCAIGDAARWEKIVENLAALTVFFERDVVPEISAAAGPAPDWFDAPG